MKKIDLQKIRVLADKEYWLSLGDKISLLVHELPRVLFIKHSHIIDIISITMVLVFAGYLVLALFLLTPSDIKVDKSGQQGLTIDLIDRLDSWIESRVQEKQRLLELSDDKLFEKVKEQN